jgi:hypothetical protein
MQSPAVVAAHVNNIIEAIQSLYQEWFDLDRWENEGGRSVAQVFAIVEKCPPTDTVGAQ